MYPPFAFLMTYPSNFYTLPVISLPINFYVFKRIEKGFCRDEIFFSKKL